MPDPQLTGWVPDNATPETLTGWAPDTPAVAPIKKPDTNIIGSLPGPRDAAVAFGKGVVDVGQSAVGIADLFSGGYAGKALDYLGYNPQSAKDIIGSYGSEQSIAAQSEMSGLARLSDKLGVLGRNPGMVLEGAIQAAPSMIGGMGASSLVGRVLPRLGGVAAAAIGEGLLGAGSSAESIRQASPDKKLTLGQTELSIGSGALSAAISLATGGLSKKLGFADPDLLFEAAKKSPALSRTIAQRIIKSLMAMGSEGTEEALQSAQEQIAQNLALGRPPTEGVSEAAVMGGATGAVMGGVGAHFEGKRKPPPATRQPTLPGLEGGYIQPNLPFGQQEPGQVDLNTPVTPQPKLPFEGGQQDLLTAIPAPSTSTVGQVSPTPTITIQPGPTQSVQVERLQGEGYQVTGSDSSGVRMSQGKLPLGPGAIQSTLPFGQQEPGVDLTTPVGTQSTLPFENAPTTAEGQQGLPFDQGLQSEPIEAVPEGIDNKTIIIEDTRGQMDIGDVTTGSQMVPLVGIPKRSGAEMQWGLSHGPLMPGDKERYEAQGFKFVKRSEMPKAPVSEGQAEIDAFMRAQEETSTEPVKQRPGIPPPTLADQAMSDEQVAELARRFAEGAVSAKPPDVDISDAQHQDLLRQLGGKGEGPANLNEPITPVQEQTQAELPGARAVDEFGNPIETQTFTPEQVETRKKTIASDWYIARKAAKELGIDIKGNRDINDVRKKIADARLANVGQRKSGPLLGGETGAVSFGPGGIFGRRRGKGRTVDIKGNALSLAKKLGIDTGKFDNIDDLKWEVVRQAELERVRTGHDPLTSPAWSKDLPSIHANPEVALEKEVNKERIKGERKRRGKILTDTGELNQLPIEALGPESQLSKKEKKELIEDLSNSGYVQTGYSDERGVPIWQRPRPTKEDSALREAWNLPRGMMSVDLPFFTSAAMRQGLPMIGVNPRAFVKAWFNSVRAYKSDRAMGVVNSELSKASVMRRQTNKDGVPQPSLAERAGLALADTLDMTKREEAIMSKWAEKAFTIKGYGYGTHVKASNRAFTAFMNTLRVSSFERMVKQAESDSRMYKLTGGKFGSEGRNAFNDTEFASEIADAVNTLTGRGKLEFEYTPELRFRGKERIKSRSYSVEGGAAQKLTDAFFSPRLMASRIKMLNPNTYITADPFVRKQLLKGLMSAVGTWWAIAGLAETSGFGKVSKDPNSADFGKIRIGNTRIDPGGGFQQFLVLFSRVRPNKLKIPFDVPTPMGGMWRDPGGGQVTSTTTGFTRELGAGFRGMERDELLYDFMRPKLHPSLSLAVDIFRASQDRPVYIGDRVLQLAVPMLAGDLADLAKGDPLMYALVMSAGTIGMGASTYEGRETTPSITPLLGKPVEKADWKLEGY